MKTSICGADCENCGYGKNIGCKGCDASCGCPTGKKCFIYEYIKVGGEESYNALKKQLTDEFNALAVDGMPEIEELYALNGAFVNLAYPMPSGEKVKLLDDESIYLGCQVESEFNDGSDLRCFGLVAGLDFLLVSEYGANCEDPQIVIFKHR